MKQNNLIKIMQDRLDDCVVRERYEMAAKLRDLIIYETTDNEEYKYQYYLKLLKKYASECSEFYEEMKKKYSLS